MSPTKRMRRAWQAADTVLGRVELIHRLLHGAAGLTDRRHAALYLDGWISYWGGTLSQALASAAHASAMSGADSRDAGASSSPVQSAAGPIGGLAVDGELEARHSGLLRTFGLQVGSLLVDWPSPWWQEALAAFEPRPSTALDSAALGVAWLGAGGDLRRSNAAFRELLPAGGLPSAVSGAALSARLCVGNRSRWLAIVPRDEGHLALLADASARQPIDKLQAFVVSDAAHELRTPLTAVRMHADVLLDLVEGDQDRPPRSFARVLAIEAERMGRLLDNLRDAAWLGGEQVVQHRRFAPATG